VSSSIGEQIKLSEFPRVRGTNGPDLLGAGQLGRVYELGDFIRRRRNLHHDQFPATERSEFRNPQAARRERDTATLFREEPT
jgi:hypothetical protein